MNTEQRETVAKFEAHLRGGEVVLRHYHSGGLVPQNSGLYNVGHDGTCDRTDGSPWVKAERWYEPTSDPTTPAGAWEWVKLLDYDLHPFYGTLPREDRPQKWGCAPGYLMHEAEWFEDPIEAVTAAVVAAAEKWEASQ